VYCDAPLSQIWSNGTSSAATKQEGGNMLLAGSDWTENQALIK